jgi:hypothetical protein
MKNTKTSENRDKYQGKSKKKERAKQKRKNED